MDKELKRFLLSKGLKDHPEDRNKMILEFGPRGGMIVFGFDIEHHEIIMSYLSRNPGDPELIFAGLSVSDIKTKFDLYEQISRELYDLLERRQF